MPFGIIDVPGDGPLAGTELLIKEEREADGEAETDTTQLKRVMHRVCRKCGVPRHRPLGEIVIEHGVLTLWLYGELIPF